MSGLNDGCLDTAFNDSFSDRVAGETRDVMDVQLHHEMLPMFVGFEAVPVTRELGIGCRPGVDDFEHASGAHDVEK